MTEDKPGVRVRRIVRLGLFVVLLVALAPLIGSACTPTRTTIDPPYRLAGVEYVSAQSLSEEVAKVCPVATGELPPRAFVTDGCSMWPDGGWRECCLAHDVQYWCGGADMNRRQADQALRSCVKELSGPAHGLFMYLGVRIGGHHLWPFGWRWGYGYDWPYKGRTEPAQATIRSAPE